MSSSKMRRIGAKMQTKLFQSFLHSTIRPTRVLTLRYRTDFFLPLRAALALFIRTIDTMIYAFLFSYFGLCFLSATVTCDKDNCPWIPGCCEKRLLPITLTSKDEFSVSTRKEPKTFDPYQRRASVLLHDGTNYPPNFTLTTYGAWPTDLATDVKRNDWVDTWDTTHTHSFTERL
jgi:hypothetical protein